jgi:hypothetical protein
VKREELAWLPVDVAARAAVEVAGLDELSPEMKESGVPVFHVLNPNMELTWEDVLGWLGEMGVRFEVVEGRQ